MLSSSPRSTNIAQGSLSGVWSLFTPSVSVAPGALGSILPRRAVPLLRSLTLRVDRVNVGQRGSRSAMLNVVSADAVSEEADS